MPRWMYGVLGLALAWLVWTKLIKPTPDISQLTTHEDVQVVIKFSSTQHPLCVSLSVSQITLGNFSNFYFRKTIQSLNSLSGKYAKANYQK